MTGVAIVVSEDATHVFADSAAIGPTGLLVKSASKIMKFERARMCAVTRGSIAHAWRLRRIVEQFASYDAARAGIVGRLRGLANWPWRLLGPFEIYVAGISGAGAPSAFMLVTHRKHEGIAPGRVVDIPYAVATGPAPDLDAERDPIGFGVRAAELQRAVLQRLPFSRAPVSIVGGFLEHVAVSTKGIETQVVGGWNDRLGERLNPGARFTPSGVGVRKAIRPRGLLATRPRQIAAFAIGAWAVLFAIDIAARLPTITRLKSTYASGSEENLTMPDGPWGIWPRPDLGKLVTERRLGRLAWEQLIGAPATAAQHEAAALDWLARQGRGCRLTGSVEVARATYEHSYRCES